MTILHFCRQVFSYRPGRQKKKKKEEASSEKTSITIYLFIDQTRTQNCFHTYPTFRFLHKPYFVKTKENKKQKNKNTRNKLRTNFARKRTAGCKLLSKCQNTMNISWSHYFPEY